MTNKDDVTEQIASYWNERSQAFGDTRQKELASENAIAWSKLLERLLPAKDKLSILDVGCGSGFLSIILARLGHDVKGIDLAKDMIYKAKECSLIANVDVAYEVMNASKIAYNSESFDVVISRNLTWTLPEIETSYLEWQRVLKNKGMLLNFDSDYGNVRFTATSDRKNNHASIPTRELDFYNDVKGSFSISKRARPAWDRDFLTKANMKVEIIPDISKEVHLAEEFHYDDVELFAIKAIKEN